MVKSLPYPGIVAGKARANFEALRQDTPYETIYFQFGPDLYNSRFFLFEMPLNGIIISTIPIKVLEPFDGNDTQLNVGVTGDPDGIGITDLNNPGVQFLYTEGFPEFGKVFGVETSIYATITSNATSVTLGRGWGIIEYLKLASVSSFRKVISG